MKALALLLLFALPAFGQVTTYVYTGQIYNSNGDSILGVMEFSHPLPASTTTNSDTQTLGLPFIEFQDAQNQNVPAGIPVTWSLTTDAVGNIVAWELSANLDWGNEACRCSNYYSASSVTGDSADFQAENTEPTPPPQVIGETPIPGHWATHKGTVAQALVRFRNATIQFEAEAQANYAIALKCRENKGC